MMKTLCGSSSIAVIMMRARLETSKSQTRVVATIDENFSLKATIDENFSGKFKEFQHRPK